MGMRRNAAEPQAANPHPKKNEESDGGNRRKGYLVGGFSPTHLKNMLVKFWIISARFGVEVKNIWNHHLATAHVFFNFEGKSSDSWKW